ncbi:Metallo-beta-lactamase superfamily [Teratosphaeria destructans]|uniref:Metallo-beta-lactamase superfamily n=1 Tax=Teratosphaeria destructans TaxID=418781 RepID=A0A9W7SJM6_9PEZI|nr:Metallo-beta-lactamase superfamily [Teratosphaeria destructans]
MSAIPPQPPPNLHIPPSDHTVHVSIIDTTGHVRGIPAAAFMKPDVPGLDRLLAPCFSFLIQRQNQSSPSKYDHLLFDLGIRKDIENSPTAIVDRISGHGFEVTVEKNVVEVLEEGGSDPRQIGGIIWSHYHWDHTGDPSTFPPSTDLIVGPGFKSRFVPAYPTVKDAPIHEGAWAGRTLREVDFETEGHGLKLGSFHAFDFYGDGSFYLLDSPGHATGHMCGLARTKGGPDSEFIIMGGDIAHHGAQFRPTRWLPLPENVQPNPFVAPFSPSASVCPGALFEAAHPASTDKATTPFTHPEGAIHDDPQAVVDSRDHWTEFDAQENVFAVIAHDETLLDVVDFYPKSANEWKAKGWKEEGRWRFLKDLDTSGSEMKT